LRLDRRVVKCSFLAHRRILRLIKSLFGGKSSVSRGGLREISSVSSQARLRCRTDAVPECGLDAAADLRIYANGAERLLSATTTAQKMPGVRDAFGQAISQSGRRHPHAQREVGRRRIAPTADERTPAGCKFLLPLSGTAVATYCASCRQHGAASPAPTNSAVSACGGT